MGKKIVVAIGIAAAILIVGLLLRRGPSEAPRVAAHLPPAETPVPSRAIPEKPAAAFPDSSAPGTTTADPRRLLVGLAKALRDSDEKAARAILKQLHNLLHPAIPDDQNAALLLQKAFDLAREKLGGLSMKELDRAVYSAVLDGKELTPEQTAALRAWFDQNGPIAAEVTALLCDASKRPQCRFPDGTSQKSVTGLLYAGNFLRVCALVEQQGGKTAEAAELTLAGMGISEAVRSSPDLVSQLIGIGCQSTSFAGLRGPLSPSLAAWLEKRDPASVRDAYLRALLGDVDLLVSRVLAADEDPARTENEEYRQKDGPPLKLQDLAAYVESINEFGRLAGKPWHETRVELDALAKQHGELAPWYATLSKDFVPSLPGLAGEIAKTEAQGSMAKLSLELQRYRERTGGYPASLDALQSPPILDPFTGQRFAYRQEGSGFILESPGNGTGKYAQTWRSQN